MNSEESAKMGTSPTTCITCTGHGQVRMQQGFFYIEQTCPKCHGSGKIPAEDMSYELFNIEIVRECLLKEGGPSNDEKFVLSLWDKCNGNPWNAGILYNLSKLKT